MSKEKNSIGILETALFGVAVLLAFSTVEAINRDTIKDIFLADGAFIILATFRALYIVYVHNNNNQ